MNRKTAMKKFKKFLKNNDALEDFIICYNKQNRDVKRTKGSLNFFLLDQRRSPHLWLEHAFPWIWAHSISRAPWMSLSDEWATYYFNSCK